MGCALLFPGLYDFEKHMVSNGSVGMVTGNVHEKLGSNLQSILSCQPSVLSSVKVRELGHHNDRAIDLVTSVHNPISSEGKIQGRCNENSDRRQTVSKLACDCY